MSDHGGLIQILFKKLALDHDPISAGQDKIGIHIFIHDLPYSDHRPRKSGNTGYRLRRKDW